MTLTTCESTMAQSGQLVATTFTTFSFTGGTNASLKVLQDGRMLFWKNLERDTAYWRDIVKNRILNPERTLDPHTMWYLTQRGNIEVNRHALNVANGDRAYLHPGVRYKYSFDVTIVDTYPIGTPASAKWWNNVTWAIVHQIHGTFDAEWTDESVIPPKVYPPDGNKQPTMEICIENGSPGSVWRVRNRYSNGDEGAADWNHGSSVFAHSDVTAFSPPPPGGSKTYHFEVEYEGDANSSDGSTGCTIVKVTQGAGLQQEILDETNIQNAYRHRSGRDLSGDWGVGGQCAFGIYTTYDSFVTDSDGDGFSDIAGTRPALNSSLNSNHLVMDIEGDGRYYEQICMIFDKIRWDVERIGGDLNLDGTIDFQEFLTFSRNFGMNSNAWADGDFDGNGTVDFADFLQMSGNFARYK